MVRLPLVRIGKPLGVGETATLVAAVLVERIPELRATVAELDVVTGVEPVHGLVEPAESVGRLTREGRPVLLSPVKGRLDDLARFHAVHVQFDNGAIGYGDVGTGDDNRRTVLFLVLRK